MLIWVVFCFERLAKSNLIILSFHTSKKDRIAFDDHVMFACCCFLSFTNAAGNLTMTKGNKRKKKRKGKGKMNCKQSTCQDTTLSPVMSWAGSSIPLFAEHHF